MHRMESYLGPSVFMVLIFLKSYTSIEGADTESHKQCTTLKWQQSKQGKCELNIMTVVVLSIKM